MIDPHWVFLSVAINLAGAVRYATLTLRGSVRPNLVTWSMWTVAPLIGFFAQLDAGVGLPAMQTLSAGLGPLIVVLSGLLSKHGRVRLTGFDITCGIFSAVALVVWLGLGQAPLAVFVAIAADGIAGVPTLVKAWRYPDSESMLAYAFTATASVITLLTVTSPSPEVWGFAAWVLLMCVSLVVIIAVRRRALTHWRSTVGA